MATNLFGGEHPGAIQRRLHQIAERIQPPGARVVLNVFDLSDGDVGRRQLELSRLATIALDDA